MLTWFLVGLGALALAKTFFRFWPFVASALGLGDKARAFRGKWAVVTGATDGIGKAYCQHLAKRGLNIVLISRTESKLRECAAELTQKSKVETKVVAADFSKASEKGFAAPIIKALDGLDIGVLVNNVGMSYSYPMWFAEEDTSDELIRELLDLNVTSTTTMTKIVLPGMVQRKAGLIINLSSAAGVNPCGSPGLACYSASKAYVAALSKSIQYETKRSNIVCEVHVPYFVSTKMSKIRKASLTVPTPESWCDASLKMSGCGGTVVIPWFTHFIQDFALGCVPEWAAGKIVFGMHQGIRKKALAKKKKQEEEEKKR